MKQATRALCSLAVTALLLASCSAGKGPGSGGGKPKVVATIGMIADAAREIGGDRVEVSALMGAGVDPHQYKASAGDVKRLGEASLILYGGLHLEARMGEVFEKMGGRTRKRAVAESIPAERLHAAGPGGHDPHVWFDVGLWKIAVASVHGALVEILPADRQVFDARHHAYQARLDVLDAYVKSNALRVPEANRVLVTAHDAFEYFGRAYGFEVRGLQGISTVSEAGTQDVQQLAAFIAQRRIPAIFVESSVPRKNVEALRAAVESRGFRVAIGGQLFSDAMGDEGTPEGTYEGMVRHNIDTIVGALLAGRP